MVIQDELKNTHKSVSRGKKEIEKKTKINANTRHFHLEFQEEITRMGEEIFTGKVTEYSRSDEKCPIFGHPNT